MRCGTPTLDHPTSAVTTRPYTGAMDSADHDSHPEPVTLASYATEGEAQVAQAKLSAYEIESAIVDQIEGGAVPIEGEAGITLAVAAQDAPDARQILDDIGTVDDVGTVDDPDADAGA